MRLDSNRYLEHILILKWLCQYICQLNGLWALLNALRTELWKTNDPNVDGMASVRKTTCLLFSFPAINCLVVVRCLGGKLLRSITSTICHSTQCSSNCCVYCASIGINIPNKTKTETHLILYCKG